MTPIIAILTAGLAFGSGIVALYAQPFLPESTKSDLSQAVVSQVSALVSLLLAMVLGTLVGTGFGFFFTQKANLDDFSVQALQFDQALAQYGPETRPVRAQFKKAFVQGYDLFWGRGDADPSALSVAAPLAQVSAINAYLASLRPSSEAQKQALVKVNRYAETMEQSRLLMSLQVAGRPVAWQLVAILAIWAIALFFGYGLFAPKSATTVVALAFGALSVGLAIFLIFDLRQPYSGVFRVSPGSLEETIRFLNR